MAFGISYAGVPFDLDSPELLQWVAERFPIGELRLLLPDSQFPGKNLGGIAFSDWPDSPADCIGTYFYPKGASRYSRFIGIATEVQAEAMRQATNGNPATFIMQADVDPTTDSRSVGGLSTSLFMLPPVPISFRPAAPDPRYNDLYLIVLVDERYQWQFRSPGKLRPDSSTLTWESMLTAIGTALGVTISPAAAIESVYGFPAEDSAFFSNYENAALLLDAIAYNTGRVVVRNLDGTYSLRTYSPDDTDVAGIRPDPMLRLAGADPLGADEDPNQTSPAGMLPDKVVVTFPRIIKNGQYVSKRLDSRDWIKSSYGDVYAKTISILDTDYADESSYAGEKVFRDTARAYYVAETDADAINKTALDALALQIANDFYAMRLGGIYETYPGIRAWTPEGTHDVVWHYCGKTSWTRVQRMPFNYGPEEMQHGFADEGSDPGSDVKLIAAKLTSLSGNAWAWTEQEPLTGGTWGNLSGGRTGTVSADAAYEANLVNPQVNDIVFLRRGFTGSPSDYRFADTTKKTQKGKLDGSLAFDGSATMSVWEYNGSAEADTTVNITVYDWLLKSGQSIPSGTRVAAAFMAGRWYVIGSQC